MKIAVLDDYQDVALQYADWSALQRLADVSVFHDHLKDEQAVVNRLKDYHIICVMRERTPLPAAILAQLPELKLIVTTGQRNASIDLSACEAMNIAVRYTGYHETGAPELAWAMLLNLARHIDCESRNIRQYAWQETVGTDLAGKTVGIVGLGRVGSRIARYARAFDMNVIAWSENLTADRARQHGAELVTKEVLFEKSDFVTLHLVLSDRTRHIVAKKELNLMKPTAYFINTARGPLVSEKALIDVLDAQRIAGAALDVYDTEPLPLDHIFRKLKNVLATPHIGYVTDDTYRIFYQDTVKQIKDWLLQHTRA